MCNVQCTPMNRAAPSINVKRFFSDKGVELRIKLIGKSQKESIDGLCFIFAIDECVVPKKCTAKNKENKCGISTRDQNSNENK